MKSIAHDARRPPPTLQLPPRTPTDSPPVLYWRVGDGLLDPHDGTADLFRREWRAYEKSGEKFQIAVCSGDGAQCCAQVEILESCERCSLTKRYPFAASLTAPDHSPLSIAVFADAASLGDFLEFVGENTEELL